MAWHYDSENRYDGSSWDRGDRVEEFDENGQQTGTTYPMENGRGTETYGYGGELVQRKWATGSGSDIYDAEGEYVGWEKDYGTHRDTYRWDGTFERSSWD